MYSIRDQIAYTPKREPMKNREDKNRYDKTATAHSGKSYRNAPRGYKESIGRSSGSHPLLSIAESASSLESEATPYPAEYARRRDRAAQAATVNALGELASVIGGGIAAAWGGNPPLPDKVSSRLAQARIAGLDKEIREEFDKNRKANLAEAVRRRSSIERSTERYLDRLYRIDRDDKNRESAAAMQRERIESAERIARERIAASQRAVQTKAAGNKSNEQSRRPQTYILDQDNKPIAIYREDMTQLYELADRLGMLDGYRSAKNSDERREELYVAIGKAYKERERLKRKQR